MKGKIPSAATIHNDLTMAIQTIARHGTSHPFGDSRTVSQAFPKGIPNVVSDPFLMSDYWNHRSTGKAPQHEDDFPVGWHPHRGMDIVSYVKQGRGRHGDSLGNRETFDGPGLQWMSVGSGVEHAEGGGTPPGDPAQGFQIWINVPAEHKLDDPDYGTVPTEQLVEVPVGAKSRARVLAGAGPAGSSKAVGPVRTKKPVQMIDFDVHEHDTVDFDVAEGLDTALLYVYEGRVEYNHDNNDSATPSTTLEAGSIAVLDANDADRRRISLSTTTATSSSGGPPSAAAQVLLFAGKKLREPVAWHGPIVMNTPEQIYDTWEELDKGIFPPKRVDWDYKTYASRPKDWKPHSHNQPNDTTSATTTSVATAPRAQHTVFVGQL